jgi:hypothetical protein
MYVRMNAKDDVKMYAGDRYPSGLLEGKKASRKASGPLFRKAIPSWARGGMSSRIDRHKIGSTRARATH